MKTKKAGLYVLTIALMMVFTNCSDDSIFHKEKANGQLNLSITDAPTDDATVEGTFITISEIRIDGKKVEGFSKQTIEISAYRDGNAKLLFESDATAKSYSTITLVLDNETDASGSAPGTYVLDSDNHKHRLAGSAEATTEITISKSFSVDENAKTEMIIDFDLRKSIVRDTDIQNQTDYKFVTKAELNSSARLVRKEDCGTIYGKVNEGLVNDKELYVFVYKKGNFNSTTESQGQGSSDVLFAKSVTSAKVEMDGSYKLPYLEEGNYEVHIVAYEKNYLGKSMFSLMVNAASSISGLVLDNVTVSADSQVLLNIKIIG